MAIDGQPSKAAILKKTPEKGDGLKDIEEQKIAEDRSDDSRSESAAGGSSDESGESSIDMDGGNENEEELFK